MFRWCTDRLKIDPTTKYIIEQINKTGEVVILLGTREDESNQRKKSMQKYQISSQRLRRHIDLSLAYIYIPLKDVLTDEIWYYLATVNSPWDKMNNKELFNIYQDANADDYECPFVINTNSPPCGNSRFGCWVCTMVKKDKSMESLINNGEKWMQPLLNIRNWLKDNRDNEDYRMKERRNGRAGKGPYTIYARAEILKQLLKAQKTIGKELITIQELKSIQIIWNMDGYLTNVYNIYNEIFNNNKFKINMNKRDKIKEEQKQKLEKICEKYMINSESLHRLLNEEKNKNLLNKRVSIQHTIERELENIF